MELDTILNDYQARKRREKQAADEKNAAERRHHEKMWRLFYAIILPVLNETCSSLVSKGHVAAVKEFDSTLYPHVELEFLPVASDGRGSSLNPSILRFQHDHSESIGIHREVKTAGGKRDHKSSASITASELSEAKARAAVVEFVFAVLREN